jgi:AcrR family transcriptional regulator
MPRRASGSQKPRKTPRQERSQRTRQDLLVGATRVLNRMGGEAFTTNHVAEATGVSVGSLYQYYPNKAALLADLHGEDSNRVWAELSAMLDDESLSARARFERVVSGAFVAQAAAQQHHQALYLSGVETLALPAMKELEQRIVHAFTAFFVRALPTTEDAASAHAVFCVEVVFALLDRIATRPERDTERLAAEVARMLADHVGLAR